MKKLSEPEMQDICVTLYRMCQAFNMAPHQYLFNDLDDGNASFKMEIDYAVFNQNRVFERKEAEVRVKEQEKMVKKMQASSRR